MVRRSEEDDVVPLIHQLRQFTMLLHHPGAGPIDHLKAATRCTLQHFRGDAMCADHHRRTLLHLIKALNVLNAALMQVSNQPLVVHHMAERMGRLPLRTRKLRLINRLADAIADASAAGDTDALNASHAAIIP